MKWIVSLFALALVCLLAATAFGQVPGVTDPAADPAGFLTALIGAAAAKNWGLLVSLAILGALAAVNWGGGKLKGKPGEFFRSDLGRSLTSFLFALVLAVVVAFKSGAPFSWPLLWGAIGATAAASGLWTWGKKFGAAALAWVLARFGVEPKVLR